MRYRVGSLACIIGFLWLQPAPAADNPGKSQTIRFPGPPQKFFGDPDFTLSASASSGLEVTLTASGDCSVSGSTIHILSAGKCVVTAHQPGNELFEPAADVDVRIPIGKSAQSIRFPKPPPLTYRDPDFDLKGEASSGLPVIYMTYGRCSVDGSKLRTLGAGRCTVTAHQPGSENFTAAKIVERELTIAKADQTIIFSPLLDEMSGGIPHGVIAVATSGLPVALATAGSCSILGQKVYTAFIGECWVTAEQPGDENVNPALPVVQNY